MNRRDRRTQERQRTALAREYIRATKPPEYHLGYNDGGNRMCQAMTLATAKAMKECGVDTGVMADVLVRAVDILTDNVLKTDSEIKEEYLKIGILFDKDSPFSEEQFIAVEV